MGEKVKAQASFEYLIIFGIALTLILILGGVFFTYSGEAKEQLDKKQIEKIGREIISNVEKMYFLPEGNKVTIDTSFPQGIENLTIVHFNNSGIVFDILNVSYYNEDIFSSELFETKETYIRFNCSYSCQHNYTTNVSWFNDTSLFTQGAKRIQIVSQGDYVSIDFVRD